MLYRGSNIVPFDCIRIDGCFRDTFFVASQVQRSLLQYSHYNVCTFPIWSQFSFSFFMSWEDTSQNELSYFKFIGPHFLVVDTDHSLLAQLPVANCGQSFFIHQCQLFQSVLDPIFILNPGFNNDPKRGNLNFVPIFYLFSYKPCLQNILFLDLLFRGLTTF